MKPLTLRTLVLLVVICTTATAQTLRFSPRTYPAGAVANAIATADVNRDGFPDIIVVNNKGTAGISVLLNNGDGTFQPPIQSNTFGEIPDQIAVGDINGDGIPDLVYVSTNFFDLAIMYGRGGGTFSLPSAVAWGGGHPNSVAIGDFNGDGRMDLVYATDGPGLTSKIQIALNTGINNFGQASFFGSRQTVMQASSAGSRLFSVTSGDINADGRPDLAFLMCCSNNTAAPIIVVQALNNGNENFSFTEPDMGTALRVYAHDFGDGRAALVLPYGPLACNGCFKNQGFSVLFNLADGTVRKTGKLFGGTQLITGDVTFGDFNGDGLQDIVLTASGSIPGSSGRDELLIWEGNGNRSFSAVTTIPMGFGEATGPLAAARFNKQLRGDDLAAVQSTPQDVSVLTNVTAFGCLPNSPGILICSPAANATTGAQVRIAAGAMSNSGHITALRFYVDNKASKTFFNTTGAPVLQGAFSKTFLPGKHQLIVVGYQSTGGFVKSTEFFTVH